MASSDCARLAAFAMASRCDRQLRDGEKGLLLERDKAAKRKLEDAMQRFLRRGYPETTSKVAFHGRRDHHGDRVGDEGEEGSSSAGAAASPPSTSRVWERPERGAMELLPVRLEVALEADSGLMAENERHGFASPRRLQVHFEVHEEDVKLLWHAFACLFLNHLASSPYDGQVGRSHPVLIEPQSAPAANMHQEAQVSISLFESWASTSTNASLLARCLEVDNSGAGYGQGGSVGVYTELFQDWGKRAWSRVTHMSV